MRIAIIGCGEVGLLYATALVDHVQLVALCDHNPSARATDFSNQRKVDLNPAIGPWLGGFDGVFSCVLGTASLAVARAALPHLKVGGVFADLATADPEAVRVAAAEMAAADINYVDIAIMGAVAMSGLKTPLLCAGTGTPTIVPIFEKLGATIRCLEGGKAGDPSALKILRSVFTKGLEALAVECFVAAEQQGVTDQLFDALADIDQTPLRTFVEGLIRTHVIHAPRRLREVEEAERQLRQANLPVAVLPGVRALFERTCADLKRSLPGEAVPTTAAAFAWLLVNAKRQSGERENLEIRNSKL